MAKSTIAVIFGWIATLFAGCAGPHDQVQTTPEGRIAAAVQQLVARSDASFAIIEHAPTGKFVQFAGSAREPLLLDLPVQALSAEERARSERLFASLGGVQTEENFQLNLGRDAGEAARIALRVFREVYELPDDAELSVSVGS